MSTEAEPSKEGFYRSFKISFDNLQDAISKLPNTTAAERNATIDKHLESIAELSQSLKDIAALLPAYDQRFYGDQIKTLETQLRKARSEGGGTKKFSFKKREKPVASETSSPASSGPSLDGKASTISPEPDQRTEEQKSQSIPVTLTYPQPVRATASADTLIISLLDASYAVFPPGSSASSGTITMINDSVVDLSARTMTAPLATLIVKNVNASLIVCGRVSGPLHISNLNRSVIVTSCQQFRLHDATDVDVYIHCASRPIIENCKNVRFAPLPPYYETPDTSASENHWDQIDDFKWLQATPSPNFSLISEHERVRNEIWKDKVSKAREIGIDTVRMVVGVWSSDDT